jgi:hypothetical protein
VHGVGECVRKEQEVEAGGVELASQLLPVFERGKGRGVAPIVRPRVADEAGGKFLERAENQLLFDALTLSSAWAD